MKGKRWKEKNKKKKGEKEEVSEEKRNPSKIRYSDQTNEEYSKVTFFVFSEC